MNLLAALVARNWKPMTEIESTSFNIIAKLFLSEMIYIRTHVACYVFFYEGADKPTRFKNPMKHTPTNSQYPQPIKTQQPSQDQSRVISSSSCSRPAAPLYPTRFTKTRTRM